VFAPLDDDGSPVDLGELRASWTHADATLPSFDGYDAAAVSRSAGASVAGAYLFRR
jgi:hypothetical protein